MKHIIFIVLIALISTSLEAAHMIKTDRNESGHDYPDNRIEGYKYFGWGMRGPGDPGYRCGHYSYDDMGYYGMMPGLMMPGMAGYGMGPGMWGYDAGRHYNFMDDTVEIRRDLLTLQFDYNEALRNRDIKRDDLIKMETEILELQMKIKEKWWNRTDQD